MHADTLEQAIDLVNADPRGNGASLFTENGAAIREFAHRLEVGMRGVNVGAAASPAYFPFSGWKDSFGPRRCMTRTNAANTSASSAFRRRGLIALDNI